MAPRWQAWPNHRTAAAALHLLRHVSAAKGRDRKETRPGRTRAIFATAKASLACAASSRILAAAPRRGGPQPKISKTTPCKVAGGRRQGRFGPTLDTSGKSTALLHHRTIR